MNEHVYDRFEKAIAEMEVAAVKVDSLLARLVGCLEKLEYWKGLQFTDTAGLLGEGVTIARGGKSLDVQEYPTFVDLKQAIEAWGKARLKADGALKAMTLDQRAKMEPQLHAKLSYDR